MKSMKLVFLLLTVTLLFPGLLSAGNVTELLATQTTEQVQTSNDNLPLNQSLTSPKETMETFLTAMSAVIAGDKSQIETALTTMDLSGVNSFIRKDRGGELAGSLFTIIENSGQIDLDRINSNKSETVFVYRKYPEGNILISRQSDGRWLFDKTTLLAIPKILQGQLTQAAQSGTADNLAVPFHAKLRAQLPAVLKDGILLEYWQWIGIFLVVAIGTIADKLLAWLLSKNVASWKTHRPHFQRIDNSTLRPLGLMAMAIIWWIGINLLGLPDTAQVILSVAIKLLVSISAVWSAYRLVDIMDAMLMKKARLTDNKFDDLLLPMITKSLKVFVSVIGIVFTADNLNVDVTSLLAGLGLAGMAFALAAKDLIGNFFGSLTVLLDRPFNIGDWVVIDDVEGTVEELGFRSTRIRTFYNSLITLPNAMMTNTKIDNMGSRRYRRMNTMLALTYDTKPEKIDAFCEGIRSLIQLHPYMRKDYYQVYFNQYGTASLDILVYVFWETPDWNTELRERHRFLLDILRLATQLEVEFAYPTQTLYLKQDDANSASAPQQFTSPISEEQAFAMGRKQAESIVDSTLGIGVKPDPVRFP